MFSLISWFAGGMSQEEENHAKPPTTTYASLAFETSQTEEKTSPKLFQMMMMVHFSYTTFSPRMHVFAYNSPIV